MSYFQTELERVLGSGVRLFDIRLILVTIVFSCDYVVTNAVLSENFLNAYHVNDSHRKHTLLVSLI